VSERGAADEEIAARLASSREAGEPVALATALNGPYAGARLLVWPAGHTFGDLGWPRLNQRVALYAEQLFERSDRRERGETVKRFTVPGAGEIDVRLSFPVA
jgi:hypothetical protein